MVRGVLPELQGLSGALAMGLKARVPDRLCVRDGARRRQAIMDHLGCVGSCGSERARLRVGTGTSTCEKYPRPRRDRFMRAFVLDYRGRWPWTPYILEGMEPGWRRTFRQLLTPNLWSARLISLAGGLQRLAKLLSSTFSCMWGGEGLLLFCIRPLLGKAPSQAWCDIPAPWVNRSAVPAMYGKVAPR